jgi:outer membrane protein TolC
MADADVEISEAAVMTALGAYDVFVTSNLGGSYAETPQRGSQYNLSLGTRRVGGGFGLRRKLETGGQVDLSFDLERMKSQQPVALTDPTLGTVDLSAHAVRPSLTVTHPLLQGVGLKVNRAEINKAKIATTAAEAQRLSVAQTMARDVISAYWDLLFAHRDLLNKRRSVLVVQDQLERTEKLVKAGRRSAMDEKGAEQALASREAELLAAETRLLDASLALHKAMGSRPGGKTALGLLPTTDPVVDPRTVVIDDEVSRALEANPQIKQVELSIASLHIDELVAANARLPRLDVEGRFAPQGRSIDTLADPTTGTAGVPATWGRAFNNMFNASGSTQGVLADWTISGSITLTWDVQNRSAKGARQRAEVEVRKAERLLEQVQQEITTAVISSAGRLRTTGKMIEVADLSLSLAQENLDAEQTKFSLGRATNYDVLLRVDDLDAAAAAALRAQIDYLKALAELQALSGEILPAYGLDGKAS